MTKSSLHGSLRQAAVVSWLVPLTALAVVMLTGCDAFFGKSAQAYYQAAQKYAERGDLPASVIELKNALQKDPQHGEARFLLGNLYLELGDGASAVKELEQAGELGVAEDRTRLPLLRARLAAGEYQKVLDAVGKMADRDEDAELLTVAGTAHAGLGDNRAAESAFRRAISIDSAAADAHVGLARLSALSGRDAEAEQHVEQALQAEPENAHAWLLKGELAFAEKRYDDAKAAFEKTRAYTGYNDIVARIALARVALAQNQPDEALSQLDVVTKRAPSLRMPQYLRGLANYQKGEMDASAEALQKVLTAVPDHLPSMFLMGSVQYLKGNFEQAEDLLARFLAAAPHHAPARKLLARIRLARQHPSDAIEALAPISDISADDPQLLALMGTAYMRSGDPERASEYLRRAAAIVPESTNLRTQLALSHLAAGATESAITELEGIVEQQEDAEKAQVLLVLAHLRAREYDKALAVADDLARQRPNAPLVYNLRGAAHLAKQEIQAARTDFEHALKIDPKFTPAIFNLAQLDLKDGDVLSARKRYEAILAVQADNPRALLALAKIESDAGNGAKAVELLEQARDRNPKAVQPRLVLANYYFQTRRYEDALAAASEANQILPTDPAVLTLLGRAQLAAGDAEMAAKTLAEAVERRPDVGEIHHYLAEAQVRSGKWDAARASYMKALELTEHKQTGPLVGLARLEAREGNAEAALALTAELRQQFPDAAIGYEVEGDILAGTEKYRSATEAYRAALERAETSQVTVKLASVQRRAGDVADAEKTLADWLAKNPDDPVARLSLASAYQKAGRSKEATFQYEQVLKVQPKNPAALNNLAWLYYEAGNPRALEIAEAALEAVPSSPAVMDTAGWLRVQSGGRVEQGLELLRKAAAGLPGNAEVQYHLGAALAKSGDARNARTHLEAAVASTQPFTGRAEAEKLLQGLQGTPQTDISH